MNAKQYFATSVVLTAVVAAVAASVHHLRKCETQACANTTIGAALNGPVGKFGPVIETILPDPKNADGPTDLLNLESGRMFLQPTFEDLNSDVEAIAAWPRSHGCDISCFLSRGSATCVTYDMTIVPVRSGSWETTTEGELLGDPALASVSHAPRRLLKLGKNQPDTYVFRTGEGTLGMLRLVGVSQQRPGVAIRYKLINRPAPAVASNLSPS